MTVQTELFPGNESRKAVLSERYVHPALDQWAGVGDEFLRHVGAVSGNPGQRHRLFLVAYLVDIVRPQSIR